MELRTSETRVDELIALYNKVRNATETPEETSSLSSHAATDSTAKSTQSLNQNLPSVSPRHLIDSMAMEQQDETRNADANNTMTLSEIVSNLQRLKTETLELQPKMAKFRQRLDEKDKVTKKPRYGEKTQARVQHLLTAYDELAQILEQQSQSSASGDLPVAADSAVPVSNDKDSDDIMILDRLQTRLEEEQARKDAQRQDQERRELHEKQEKERIEREAKMLEEQRLREEQERLAQQEAAEQAELRQRAEQVRQERQAALEAERLWVESIKVSPEGVKEQIQILNESTASDPEARRTALSSLYQLFQQINAHPEETRFRRVRRDHEQFNNDIGRHKGGKEILIAAGFELGAIDDVPCFISKEPDIEKDMDGWSAWFDLLKATLQILEQEQ